MVVVFGSAQQVESHEARDVREVAVTRGPDFFESRFGSECDLKTVHRDEHGDTFKEGRFCL